MMIPPFSYIFYKNILLIKNITNNINAKKYKNVIVCSKHILRKMNITNIFNKRVVKTTGKPVVYLIP